MKLDHFYKESIENDMHTLLAPPHNFTLPAGNVICNFHLDAEAMTAAGWREWSDEELAAWHAQYDRPAPACVRQRCTKYQLVTCLRRHFAQLLTQLRSAYASNADLQFFWNTVQELDRGNADFQSAAAALGITDAQIAEIFEKIEE